MAEKITPEEIMWIKDKLKFLGKLENYTKHDIGTRGYKGLAKKSILFIVSLILSICISVFGGFMFYQTKSPLFLSTFIFLILSYFIYYLSLNSLRNKNVFVLLSEVNDLKILKGASAVVEEYIFSHKDIFDDIIMWKNQKESKSKSSISLLIKPSTWSSPKESKFGFKIIAQLMASLQKTIKNNRKVYDEAVRKGISPGYGFNPANISNQTFNNLPRPAVKPLFGGSAPSNKNQSLFGNDGKQTTKTNGILNSTSPNVNPLSQKPKDFLNNNGAKTSGIFTAPQRPMFGQEEKK